MSLDVPGQRATIPYIYIEGQGGRNVVERNNLEATDPTMDLGAVHLYDCYASYVIANGMERIGGKGITLKDSTSCVVIHSMGEWSGSGYVWESPQNAGYTQVPAGFTTSPDGNMFIIAPQRALH